MAGVISPETEQAPPRLLGGLGGGGAGIRSHGARASWPIFVLQKQTQYLYYIPHTLRQISRCVWVRFAGLILRLLRHQATHGLSNS